MIVEVPALAYRSVWTDDEQVLRDIPRAEGAHYDSAANSAKSFFQEGTRTELLQLLDQWQEAQYDSTVTDAQPVFLLTGEAGTGKSTVAYEFAKRLRKRERLMASFFFIRGLKDLNSPSKFFSTVSSQLAGLESPLREHIISSARKHRRFGDLRQLQTEYEDLLQTPLSKLPPSHPPIFLLVDGLDECTEMGPELVPELLKLLISCATTPGSPLRLLFTSCPVPQYIFNVFNKHNFLPHISRISMQQFRHSIDQDIETLIRDKLSKEETSRRWSEADPSIVTTLVDKSNGLFIYARTAVEFILEDAEDSTYELQTRYDALLDGDGAVGFTALDSLYRTVLDSVFSPKFRCNQEQEGLRRLLGYLVALQDSEEGELTPKTLCGLTGIPVVESVRFLNKLRSVVLYERGKADGPFSIIHATFREFLSPHTPSAWYHVNAREFHTILVADCMRTLHSFVQERWTWTSSTGASLLFRLLTEPSPDPKDFPHVVYAVKYVDHHNNPTYQPPSEVKQRPGNYRVNMEEPTVPHIAAVARFALMRVEDRISSCMWHMIRSVLSYVRSHLPPASQALLGVLDRSCILQIEHVSYHFILGFSYRNSLIF